MKKIALILRITALVIVLFFGWLTCDAIYISKNASTRLPIYSIGLCVGLGIGLIACSLPLKKE